MKSPFIFIPLVVALCSIQFPSPVAAQVTLTPNEIQWLIYIREEEKMARDLYIGMYNSWGLSIFKSISEEEQEHINAMLELFKMYSIVDPLAGDVPRNYTNQHIANLHTSLLTQGMQSNKDGLKACALQEEISMQDLDLAMKSTQQQAINKVYSELQRDSINHLRSFIHSLEIFGERYMAVKIPQQTVDAIILDKMDRGFMLR